MTPKLLANAQEQRLLTALRVINRRETRRHLRMNERLARRLIVRELEARERTTRSS